MRIAIVGYGKMGKLVRAKALERGHEVTAIIDPFADGATDKEISSSSLGSPDIVIDFSSPASIKGNIESYSRLGVSSVIGTTGWKICDVSISPNVRFMYSGNFSIGVAIFLALAKKAGALLSSVDGYDVAIHEVHHRMKADSPSGTALMAAEKIMDGYKEKTSILLGNSEGRIAENALQITSERVGSEPGLHEIVIDSAEDTITIEHHARSREGFAKGVIRAAEWLIDKENGIYTMDDFIKELGGFYD